MQKRRPPSHHSFSGLQARKPVRVSPTPMFFSLNVSTGNGRNRPDNGFWHSFIPLDRILGRIRKGLTSKRSIQPNSAVPGLHEPNDIRRYVGWALHRLKDFRTPKSISSNSAASTSMPLDASSQLSNFSATLPRTSARRIFASYLALSKPRLTFLIVLTTTTAYSVFPIADMHMPLSLSTVTLLFLSLGTGLASASANTLNMLAEPEYDAKMSRTRNRPLVRGLLSRRAALLFALASGTAGIVALYYGVNPTVAGLGALNVLLYAGVYTPLKRTSVINTWVGALVGGIPPLMGWAAAAGSNGDEGWQTLLFGEQSTGGWLLAALLYAWQFPHFNALSWTIREEYRNAGYRMLAWVNPAMNGRVAFRYSLLTFPICFALTAAGVTDPAFVVTSSMANAWMAWKAAAFWMRTGANGSARSLFWASVWHLPVILVLVMAHKKGLLERLLQGAGITWERESEIDAARETGNTDLAAMGERKASDVFSNLREDEDEEDVDGDEAADDDDDDEDDDDDDDGLLNNHEGLPQLKPIAVPVI